MSRPRVQWFARGGGVIRMGPFKTQVEAANAMVIAKSDPSAPRFPDDVFIWPEFTKSKKRRKRG